MDSGTIPSCYQSLFSLLFCVFVPCVNCICHFVCTGDVLVVLLKSAKSPSAHKIGLSARKRFQAIRLNRAGDKTGPSRGKWIDMKPKSPERRSVAFHSRTGYGCRKH